MEKEHDNGKESARDEQLLRKRPAPNPAGDIPQLSKYRAEVARSVNVLLVGKTTSGKTTMLKVLENERFVPPPKTIVSDTKEARICTLSVTAPDDSKVQLNIIDTPGLFETRTVQGEARENDVLMQIAQNCVIQEITKLHVLCIVANVAAGLLRDDVETIRQLIEFFGSRPSRKIACWS